jgi:hypothetical protein
VRFTVWRTIMIVAASATGLAVVSYHRNASHYRERARFHSRQSIVHAFASKGQEGLLVGCPSDGGTGGYCLQIPKAETAADRARMSRMARYHADLASKYDRAVALPWLLVGPDPPPPVP